MLAYVFFLLVLIRRSLVVMILLMMMIRVSYVRNSALVALRNLRFLLGIYRSDCIEFLIRKGLHVWIYIFFVIELVCWIILNEFVKVPNFFLDCIFVEFLWIFSLVIVDVVFALVIVQRSSHFFIFISFQVLQLLRLIIMVLDWSYSNITWTLSVSLLLLKNLLSIWGLTLVLKRGWVENRNHWRFYNVYFWHLLLIFCLLDLSYISKRALRQWPI